MMGDYVHLPLEAFTKASAVYTDQGGNIGRILVTIDGSADQMIGAGWIGTISRMAFINLMEAFSAEFGRVTPTVAHIAETLTKAAEEFRALDSSGITPERTNQG